MTAWVNTCKAVGDTYPEWLLSDREEPGACKHCPGGNPSNPHCILRNGNYCSSTFSQWRQVEEGLSIAYLSFSASQDSGCEGPIIAQSTAGPQGLHVPFRRSGRIRELGCVPWCEEETNQIHCTEKHPLYIWISLSLCLIFQEIWNEINMSVKAEMRTSHFMTSALYLRL